MRASRGRYLVALLALYVGLEFANPLMPGAVYFADGVVTVVEGARSALDGPATGPAPASGPYAVAPLPPAPTLSSVAAVARTWPAPVRRPEPRAAAAPPAVGEDH